MSELLGKVKEPWQEGYWRIKRLTERTWELYSPKGEVINCVLRFGKGVITDCPDTLLEQQALRVLSHYSKLMAVCPECLEDECIFLLCHVDRSVCDLVYFIERDEYVCRYVRTKFTENCPIWNRLVPKAYKSGRREG